MGVGLTALPFGSVVLVAFWTVLVAELVGDKSIYIDPYDLPAHELMLDIAKKTNDQAVIERETRVIPVLSKWIAEYRKSTMIEGAPQP